MVIYLDLLLPASSSDPPENRSGRSIVFISVLLRMRFTYALTRGNDARETISRWDSVRKGEEDNIFPYQEEADVMFNSAQIYEIAVLKQYAEPLLFAVPRDCPEYQEAKRLLKFLEYFLNIPSEAIPKTSLLREFIGGSCFEV